MTSRIKVKTTHLAGSDRQREVHPASFLMIILDACRYDTMAAASVPNLRRVGPIHRAFSPGNSTISSHVAMFMGFTPGDPSRREPYVNPKYARIFLLSGGQAPHAEPFVSLDGPNIIAALKSRGYTTLGTGAIGWFNPARPTSRVLVEDFDDFFYPGGMFSLARQVRFVQVALDRTSGPVFLFMNVGETHPPYYFKGAPWRPQLNPAAPFGDSNDADEARRRQTAALEFVDAKLGDLLDRFAPANTIISADHGQAWGEDGLWAAGIYHPKVHEVPLILRLNHRPTPHDLHLGPAERVRREISRARARGRQLARRARRRLR